MLQLQTLSGTQTSFLLNFNPYLLFFDVTCFTRPSIDTRDLGHGARQAARRADVAFRET